MPRLTPPRAAERDLASARAGRIGGRPSALKLLLRRQRRLLRPVLWGCSGFVAVLAGIVLLHSARPGGSIATLRERLGRAVNLRVTDVVVAGRANTPEPLLRAAIGVSRGDPILGFSVEAARARIETLSWVEHVAVERRLPGTIFVQVIERRPFAIWQNQGRFVLIDRDGQVVANQDVSPRDWGGFASLPLVVGAGAPAHAARLLDGLAALPEIRSRVTAAVRVGERRWNLQMRNGTTVMLPEGAVPQALAKLAELQSADALLDRPLASVDLRLADRMAIRPLAPTAGSATPVQAAAGLAGPGQAGAGQSGAGQSGAGQSGAGTTGAGTAGISSPPSSRNPA
jgi:cell division protein FtsQ